MPRTREANSPKDEKMIGEEIEAGSSKVGDVGSSSNFGALRHHAQLHGMVKGGGGRMPVASLMYSAEDWYNLGMNLGKSPPGRELLR